MHAGQQEGSAEQFLMNTCGIEQSKVDGIIRAAVAWRITPGGRQLIDRRRRSRIERNMLQCAEYLVRECGIEPGQTWQGRLSDHNPSYKRQIHVHAFGQLPGHLLSGLQTTLRQTASQSLTAYVCQEHMHILFL